MQTKLASLESSYRTFMAELNALKTQRTLLQDKVENAIRQKSESFIALAQASQIAEKAEEMNVRGIVSNDEVNTARLHVNEIRKVYEEAEELIKKYSNFQGNLSNEIANAVSAATHARDIYCSQIQQDIIKTFADDRKCRERMLELKAAMSASVDGVPLGQAFYVDWEVVLVKAITPATDQELESSLAKFESKYGISISA